MRSILNKHLTKHYERLRFIYFYLFFNGSKEAFDPFLLSEENKIQIVMLLGR